METLNSFTLHMAEAARLGLIDFFDVNKQKMEPEQILGFSETTLMSYRANKRAILEYSGDELSIQDVAFLRSL